MPSDGNKEPLENLKDKFRSLFGLKDPLEKNKALPPPRLVSASGIS